MQRRTAVLFAVFFAVSIGLVIAKGGRGAGAAPGGAVGDSSGQLGPMLLHGARLADSQADRAIRTAVSLLEPTLILVFGAVVLLIAGALLSAVYSLRPGL